MVRDINKVAKSAENIVNTTIRQKAIDDGTFMKASNDKPTSLTENQDLQIKAKPVIIWFGNWLATTISSTNNVANLPGL